MNPENPTPREALEARLTALLLGELPADEAAALRAAIAQDAELAALHARLQPTISIVRETAAHPATEAAEQSAPLRLSAERREKLLAHFKTVTPKEFTAPEKQGRRVNLLQMAAVLALLGLLAGLLLPALAKSKAKAQRAVAQNDLKSIGLAYRAWESDYSDKSLAQNNLHQIDGTKQEWALANKQAETPANDAWGNIGPSGSTTASDGRAAESGQPSQPRNAVLDDVRSSALGSVNVTFALKDESAQQQSRNGDNGANNGGVWSVASANPAAKVAEATTEPAQLDGPVGYVSSLDSLPDTAGHGTHVVGTIGSTASPAWGSFDGTANPAFTGRDGDETVPAMSLANDRNGQSGNGGGNPNSVNVVLPAAEPVVASDSLDTADQNGGPATQVPTTLSHAPIHRYTFNNPAVDANGTLVGNGSATIPTPGDVMSFGPQLDVGPYVMPSNYDAKTVETWASFQNSGGTVPFFSFGDERHSTVAHDNVGSVNAKAGSFKVAGNTFQDGLIGVSSQSFGGGSESEGASVAKITVGGGGGGFGGGTVAGTQPNNMVLKNFQAYNGILPQSNVVLDHMEGGTPVNGAFVDLTTNLIASTSSHGVDNTSTVGQVGFTWNLGGTAVGRTGGTVLNGGTAPSLTSAPLADNLRGFYDGNPNAPTTTAGTPEPVFGTSAGTLGSPAAPTGPMWWAKGPEGEFPQPSAEIAKDANHPDSLAANSGPSQQIYERRLKDRPVTGESPVPTVDDMPLLGKLFSSERASAKSGIVLPNTVGDAGQNTVTAGGKVDSWGVEVDANKAEKFKLPWSADEPGVGQNQSQRKAIVLANAEPQDVSGLVNEVYPQGSKAKIVAGPLDIGSDVDKDGLAAGESDEMKQRKVSDRVILGVPQASLVQNGVTMITTNLQVGASYAIVTNFNNTQPVLTGGANYGLLTQGAVGSTIGSTTMPSYALRQGGAGGRGGGAAAGTRTYQNATSPGPVTAKIDPETGSMIVMTDDSVFTNVMKLIKPVDQPVSSPRSRLTTQGNLQGNLDLTSNQSGPGKVAVEGWLQASNQTGWQNYFAFGNATATNQTAAAFKPFGGYAQFYTNGVLADRNGAAVPATGTNANNYLGRSAYISTNVVLTGQSPAGYDNAGQFVTQGGMQAGGTATSVIALPQFEGRGNTNSNDGEIYNVHVVGSVQTKDSPVLGLTGTNVAVGAVVSQMGQQATPAAPAAQLTVRRQAALNQMIPQPPPPPVAGDNSPPRQPSPPLEPQPEVLVSENAFSTFSLNVSDVSFKLSAASLEKGLMPDPGSVRSEEFINAFDYRDPDPAPGVPVGFAWERAQYPFAHNRDLLRFSIKTAAAGRLPGRPLNIVLLLDNSGSMERADRVAIIHEALRVLATQLQPQDKISIVTFARTPRLWVDGISGDKAAQVLELISELTPEGGTNLGDALDLAYATALRHYLANGVNRVVVLTDGAANLGNVDTDSLKQKVQTQRAQGIALDCFGIGWEDYNDDLLEVLTRNGDGRYGFINSPEEAADGFAAQLAGALHVQASDVKVQVEFNPQRVVSHRQIGYAKQQLTKEQFRDNTVHAAQIGAAEAGNGLYTVEVNPQGQGPICTVRLRYRDPGTSDVHEHSWDIPYNGEAVPLEQSSPAMRLAATASAFSEWLGQSPFAGEVTPDQLLGYLRGVPQVFGADTRPTQLEWMIRQAKSVTGK